MMLPPGQAYLMPSDAVVRAHDFGAFAPYQASTFCGESLVSSTIGTPIATADAGMLFMLWPAGYIGSVPFIDAANTVVQANAVRVTRLARDGVCMVISPLCPLRTRMQRYPAMAADAHALFVSATH